MLARLEDEVTIEENEKANHSSRCDFSCEFIAETLYKSLSYEGARSGKLEQPVSCMDFTRSTVWSLSGKSRKQNEFNVFDLGTSVICSSYIFSVYLMFSSKVII